MDFLDWFVTFRNPFSKANGQVYWEPTFLTNELEFYTLAVLTFVHAKRHGGRYLWLWFAILCHGLTVELVSYWVEPIDNFWHAQATFMFFGRREPLQIILVYPSYLYICAVATQRLRFPELCEGPTLALMVILLDIPYDVMGIKLLWWTWHDTDSNIRDRHYWVPWTSYYFHMTFACAFTLIYNAMRRRMTGMSGTYSQDEIERMPYSRKLKANNFRGEFIAMGTAGLFAMPFGICQFVPGYHWGRDFFNIHAEFTTLVLAAIYLSVAIYGFLHRRPTDVREVGERERGRDDKRSGRGRWYYDEAYLAMLIHFGHYMILILVANPQTYQVLGLHQPMGSAPGSTDGYACDQTRNISYPYPFTPSAWPPFLQTDLLPEISVWKRPYLCENELLLDEGVFGFECAKAKEQPWVPGNQWFWICGTDFTNKGTGTSWWEYLFLIWGSCLLGINAFTMFFCYPRTIFNLGEFPKYYKTDQPSEVIVSVEDSRTNEYGEKEFKVRVASKPTMLDHLFDLNGQKSGKSSQNTRVKWETKRNLEQDGVGAEYGERGGLYGQMFDTYYSSTRERLRIFESREHSLLRLSLRNRKTDAGFTYKNGIRTSSL
mmetsp:Transcript_2906/g.4173  ORF Transcript_2906/g.4173 Transcript_2906/m.4173 type:complete len:601 (-) Transcript_2906:1140-2942(-)